MIHDETLYIGCNSSIDKTNINQSYVIRFCVGTAHATCTVLSLINPAFYRAQLLADEHITDQPYHVSVLWPRRRNWQLYPGKDPESSLDRVKWYFKNLLPPKNGMIVSFYMASQMSRELESPWEARYIWPTKRQWDPKNKYISIQKPENLGSISRRKYCKSQYDLMMPKIEKFAKRKDVDIKYLDYSNSLETWYEVLLNSNYHFSYNGATYYFCSATNTPTVCWTMKEKYYCNFAFQNSITRKTENIESLNTCWGSMASNSTNIPHFNPKVHSKVYNKPVDYITNIVDPEDLTLFLFTDVFDGFTS